MKRETIERLYWDIEQVLCYKDSLFDEYYVHLQRTFLQAIREIKGNDFPKLTQELLQELTVQLQRITMRVLIFEMKLSEECGELTGNTPEERYQSFAQDLLQKKDFLKELYKEYPLMYETMISMLENAVRNVEEIWERFEQDKEALNQRFFKTKPCRTIVQIGGGVSDSHREGHKVYVLELDNGKKLVYKPRCLAIDQAYKDFVEWIFEKLHVPFAWNKIWNRENYGWCEWVEKKPCYSWEELQRYYQRNGILLGVSYLLGTKDIHYENVIACGEYPVIIDLEMAIGGSKIRDINIEKEQTEAERVFRESVLQTGILPLYAWNSAGEGVNVSAMNGQGGQLFPFVVPAVMDAGTTNMHIEYQQPKMKEGKNLATLAGTFIEPNEFLVEIEQGFECTYQFLMTHQKEVEERLQRFKGVQVRYLIRDTQQYTMLRTLAYHPDCLTDKEAKYRVWDAWNKQRDWKKSSIEYWIQEQEMQEWLRDDIPYFYFEAGETTLYSATGAYWENYFETSVLAEVEQRLIHMCKKDMENQRRMIRAALLMGTKNWGAAKRENRSLIEKDFKFKVDKEIPKGYGSAAAEKVGDFLLKEAIWSEDRKNVGWISIIAVGYQEQSYLIRSMNPYLYDGLAGMAIFFDALARRTQRKRYHEITEVLIRQLFSHTDRLYQNPNKYKKTTGAYTGESSIAFAYLLLYSDEKRADYLFYLKKQCEATAHCFADDTTYDVLGGNAGAILVFLNVFELTGEIQYLKWAEEAGGHLLRAAKIYEWGMGWTGDGAANPLTGFAHGSAGIMLALTKLGYFTQNEKYWDAAYQAYLWEEHYYQKRQRDWTDLRLPEWCRQESQNMAWCHGWGGIVMARLSALNYAEGVLKEQLERTIDSIKGKQNYCIDRAKFCLCHGLSGNSVLLSAIGQKSEAFYWKNKVIEEICRAGKDFQEQLDIQECENLGLMGGIAGIGYGCLCGWDEVIRLMNIQIL